MIKLNAIKSEKIWGYELWIASTHPNGCQKDFEKFAGGDYPLLVKVIQANDVLSVQVHPDDEKAKLLENCRGKTECWYILDAAPGAKLIYGMKKKYSDEELKKAIETSSLEPMMKEVAVKKGDFAYIPSGTVHAIGGGLRLLEVQQSSDITYRLYDWGRGRECHVEKGIACIKNYENQKVIPFPKKFECPYFEMEEVSVDGQYSYSVKEGGSQKKPSDTELLFVLEGSGSVNGQPCNTEDIFALASGENVAVSGKLRIMKIRALDA